jgi:hypothetical protein
MSSYIKEDKTTKDTSPLLANKNPKQSTMRSDVKRRAQRASADSILEGIFKDATYYRSIELRKGGCEMQIISFPESIHPESLYFSEADDVLSKAVIVKPLFAGLIVQSIFDELPRSDNQLNLITGRLSEFFPFLKGASDETKRAIRFNFSLEPYSGSLTYYQTDGDPSVKYLRKCDLINEMIIKDGNKYHASLDCILLNYCRKVVPCPSGQSNLSQSNMGEILGSFEAMGPRTDDLVDKISKCIRSSPLSKNKEFMKGYNALIKGMISRNLMNQSAMWSYYT